MRLPKPIQGALIAVTSGSSGACVWLPIEFRAVLRGLFGLPKREEPVEAPHDPERWRAVSGRSRLPPGSDVRGPCVMGFGVQVFVRQPGGVTLHTHLGGQPIRLFRTQRDPSVEVA